MTEETRALLISPIRFGEELQKWYNLCVPGDVFNKRITEKANNSKEWKARGSFWRKGNVPTRLCTGEPILSNR